MGKTPTIDYERLLSIAKDGINGLLIDGEDSAYEYFADTMLLTREEAEVLDIDYDEMMSYSKYRDEPGR